MVTNDLLFYSCINQKLPAFQVVDHVIQQRIASADINRRLTPALGSDLVSDYVSDRYGHNCMLFGTMKLVPLPSNTT